MTNGESFTAISLQQSMVLKCPHCKGVVNTGSCVILVQNELGFHILGTRDPVICPRDGREEKGLPMLFETPDAAWEYAVMVDDDGSMDEHNLVPILEMEVGSTH